eukprot:scaffold1130_cov195-Pinguiococcus_pyrenoidosus.AAC.89
MPTVAIPASLRHYKNHPQRGEGGREAEADARDVQVESLREGARYDGSQHRAHVGEKAVHRKEPRPIPLRRQVRAHGHDQPGAETVAQPNDARHDHQAPKPSRRLQEKDTQPVGHIRACEQWETGNTEE